MRGFLWALAAGGAVVGVAAALTAQYLGPNFYPPVLAAAGCVGAGVALAVLALRGGASATAGLVLAVLSLAPAGLCWWTVPTASGWSNADAANAADRADRVLRANTLRPADLRVAWADATRLQAEFPSKAERMKQAKANWAGRFEPVLRDLQAGRTGAAEFTANQSERTTVAADVPEYAGRVAAAERAWAEFHARRLTARLTDLDHTGELRKRADEGEHAVLAERFPDLAAGVAAAETGWLDRSESRLVTDLRAVSATDPQAFLALRAAAADFGRRHPDRYAGPRKAAEEWAGRCERAGLEKAAGLAGYPARAAAELVETSARLRAVAADPLPPGLKAELAKAVRAALDAGRAANQAAIRADRFQAAAVAAERLGFELGPAAALAGLAADLETFRESCRFLAELAQKAGKPDPP